MHEPAGQPGGPRFSDVGTTGRTSFSTRWSSVLSISFFTGARSPKSVTKPGGTRSSAVRPRASCRSDSRVGQLAEPADTGVQGQARGPDPRDQREALGAHPVAAAGQARERGGVAGEGPGVEAQQVAHRGGQGGSTVGCHGLRGVAEHRELGPDVALFVPVESGRAEHGGDEDDDGRGAAEGGRVRLGGAGQQVAAVGMEEAVGDLHGLRASERLGLGFVDHGGPAREETLLGEGVQQGGEDRHGGGGPVAQSQPLPGWQQGGGG
ncbi:hypothetical protein KAURM247S_00853 [Kitasatospora aureofaciens]